MLANISRLAVGSFNNLSECYPLICKDKHCLVIQEVDHNLNLSLTFLKIFTNCLVGSGLKEILKFTLVFSLPVESFVCTDGDVGVSPSIGFFRIMFRKIS
jgi:hypothetical protein